ncbi:MAG: hypothetical protein HY866_14720 [Chloroflexi bacterium]|nr:hypothetical protein [Chloroflexota bacterium]
MSHHRSGPSPLLVVALVAFMIFGGYFVWVGFLDFLEDQGDITAQVTRQAVNTATALSAPVGRLPTQYMPATFTPLPPCQWYKVNVERAVYRDCPSKDNTQCPIRDVVTYDTEMCVYSRAPENPEWYIVELNPGGAYREIVFMHESVLEPVNPTPTVTATATPLPPASPTPFYTATPSDTPLPSITPAPTQPPVLDASPSPALPTITPLPTSNTISA